VQDSENQKPVETKLFDAPYVKETMDKLCEHELIKVNFGGLRQDFHRIYEGILEQVVPLPPDHAGKIKSDLFAAFCRGAVVATDIQSAFRKNFNLPESVIEEIAKPKIILPDSDIKAPEKKIIV
jgi:hypothetical protein